MNKVYKGLSAFSLLISLWLLAIARLFPICSGLGNGRPMPCHYTYQAVFLFALLAAIASLGLFALRTDEAKAAAGFFVFAVGVFILALPQSWASGICAHGGSCAKTAFFSNIGAAALAASGAFLCFSRLRMLRLRSEG
ncbi:MAG: DUF4418 family protein [Acidaminococcales bacterium]|nr:DUF4418 family protein [Acidaminococcales bacterium]